MSETNSPDIPAELIAEAIAADSRFEAIGKMYAVQGDLDSNETVKAIMLAVWSDCLAAIEELAEISPLDHDGVARLLVRVRTQVYIRRTLNGILQRGKAAEASIRAQDQNRESE